MSTTITYKNNTIATINNNGAKVLNTAGTWLEDDITIQQVINPVTPVAVTPYTTSQTITPSGDYITQVNVAAISYVETANSCGITVTIGTVAPSNN